MTILFVICKQKSFIYSRAPSSLSICPQLCIPTSSSITSFPPIPHIHTSFSLHPHPRHATSWQRMQPSFSSGRVTQISQSATFTDNPHLSLTPPSILHFPLLFFLFLCLLRPRWNEGLMKINDASQLPYPTPICFFRSCGGEFPWNLLIPQSVLPDRFTALFFFFFLSLRNSEKAQYIVGWSWGH